MLDLMPRFLNGLLEIPVHHVRGGTSTGIVLDERCLPDPIGLREEVIRAIMGVPPAGGAPGNRQLTGLGRGVSTSNKVFIIGPPSRPDADIDSTLAQLASDKSAIDWSVNCGNMSAALPFVAFEAGLLAPEPGPTRVRIHNRNTGVITRARLSTPAPGEAPRSDTAIPGVLGAWPGVWLSLDSPAGAKTGKLFPTGARSETIGGVKVSCVDFAMPMVIARASDFGCTAEEPPERLEANGALIADMRRLWVAAGLKMGLARDGRPMTAEELAVSETVPKLCLIASPDERETAQGVNIRDPRALLHAADLSPLDGGYRRIVPRRRRPYRRHARLRGRGRAGEARRGARRARRGDRKPRRHPGGEDHRMRAHRLGRYHGCVLYAQCPDPAARPHTAVQCLAGTPGPLPRLPPGRLSRSGR